MVIFDYDSHQAKQMRRAANSMVYSRENWQLLLMDHSGAFGSKKDRPKYLADIELQLTGTWLEALTALSDDVLAENLGDVLDKWRLSALGKRRDLLLREVERLN